MSTITTTPNGFSLTIDKATSRNCLARFSLRMAKLAKSIGYGEAYRKFWRRQVRSKTKPKQKRTTEVEWQSVNKIVAYKVDLFAVDLICLGFTTTDGRYSEVHEEMADYDKFCEQLESRFALREGWWSEVAFPAFETNLTVIWPCESDT